MNIRNLILAGTVAVAAALTGGVASAAPSGLGAPTVTDSAVTSVYYPGHGYGYGHRRLCRLPFFVLVRYVGYWRAKMIKSRCHFRPYYGY
jgi:hypothetical protein